MDEITETLSAALRDPAWVTGVAISVALLFVAVATFRAVYRRWERDTEEMAAAAALPPEPPEPVDDPCVRVTPTGVCGHSRGDHYQRLDRTRGACTVGTTYGPAATDPEGHSCLCVGYVPDRPTPAPPEPEVYDQETVVIDGKTYAPTVQEHVYVEVPDENLVVMDPESHERLHRGEDPHDRGGG